MNSNPSMAMLSSWTESMTNNPSGGSRGRPPSNIRSDTDHKSASKGHYDEEDLPMNRELRANSSIERFENWTDSMQKSKKSTPSKKKDNDDGYEDEEFEDYDEDFEDDEQEAPPKKPAYVEPVAPTRQEKTVNSSYNNPTNNYINREEPAVPKPVISRSNYQERESEPVEAKSTRASKFDNMTISLNSMRIADPRVIRAQKLLAANVMEMGPAKSTILNILPVSKYDLYMRNLRLANAPVRQIGVPFDLDKRDIDTNTDTIEMVHKSMQFSYGDDTTFYRIMDNIRAKRNKHEESKQNDNEGDRRNTTNFTTMEMDSTSVGATRLASFLQHASRICETLLDEQVNNNTNGRGMESGESKSNTNRRDDSRNQYSLFDANKDWVTLGKDTTNGGNETIRTRRIACVKFSPLQPHLLVSAHVFPTDESAEMDLKPYKGLYCVWDVGNPGGPQYVLEGSGQPTVCCFSATQSHFVVGGTLEGSLHLWDLREASSIHTDR